MLSAKTMPVRAAGVRANMMVRPKMMARRGPVQVSALFGSSAATTTGSFHDYEVKDIDGKSIKLDQYKGKVALVVNLASACGFTKQYADLEALYKQYKNKGFTVIGFPCNQFGAQEPGSNPEIKKFATSKFNVTFPLMSKVDVNGPGAEPVFKFLRESKGELFGNDIKWNFSKFLVDKDGKVVGRYPSTTSPGDITKDIEKLL